MSEWSPPGPVVLVDGRRQRDASVRLAFDDPGLARGEGVFETIAVLDGQAVLLHHHLDRLARGATALGLAVPDLGDLGFQVLIALSSWAHLEGVLRIQLTAHGHTILAISPARPRRSRASAVSLHWPSAPFPPANVKHTSRAGARLACQVHGVDEVLRLDDSGGVLEGTWSNAFCVRDDTVFTASLDGRILPGITRALVLEACAAAGIGVVEQAPRPGPGGWFLSSSLQGVVPVTVLDGQQQAVPAVVRRLRAAVDERVGRKEDGSR